MKHLLYHVITALLLTLFTSVSECFRVRRSGLAGYADPYGLSNEYSDMGRPRRGNYRTSYRNILDSEDDSLFNPNSISNLDDEYLRTISLDNAVGNSIPMYAYDTPYRTYPSYADPRMDYRGLEEPTFNPIKRRAYTPRRRVPSIDELRSLFGEAEVPPMKRLVPVKRREPEKEIDEEKETEVDKSETQKIVKDKKELANEWGKLIDAAEKLTEEGVAVSDKVEKTEEDKELKDIFKDAQTETKEGAATEERQTEEENKFEVSDIENYNTEKVQSKSKRASSSDVGDTSDYILGLLKQIEELKEKVTNLELLQMLEDRENDFLANALKYATLDQIHESDDLVSDEYNNIAKATETEELIQKVSEALDDEEKQEEEEVEEEAEDMLEPAQVKRADGPGPLTEEKWLDAPVNENVGFGAILEDHDGDSDGLGSEQPIDIPYPDDDDEDEEEEEAEEEVVEEAIAEEQNAEKLKNEEVLLAKLISSLSPVTVQEIIQDLKNKEQQEPVVEDDICPAVNVLSQNCAFADAKSIPIDDEARNLCVRHQICYTCGRALRIPQENCDEGYKGTVIGECNGDVNCVRAAAIFLQLMVSRYHTYEEFSPKECANPCVADFIYGVE